MISHVQCEVFESFNMLLIAFIHYIAWCFDLINAKCGASREGYFLLMTR